MHFNFVSPFDYPDYTPQDGDTWDDFRSDGRWDATGTVKTGVGLITRRFKDGVWMEYDRIAEYPPEIRSMFDAGDKQTQD